MQCVVAPFLGIGHIATSFAETPTTVASPIVVVVVVATTRARGGDTQ